MKTEASELMRRATTLHDRARETALTISRAIAEGKAELANRHVECHIALGTLAQRYRERASRRTEGSPA